VTVRFKCLISILKVVKNEANLLIGWLEVPLFEHGFPAYHRAKVALRRIMAPSRTVLTDKKNDPQVKFVSELLGEKPYECYFIVSNNVELAGAQRVNDQVAGE